MSGYEYPHEVSILLSQDIGAEKLSDLMDDAYDVLLSEFRFHAPVVCAEGGNLIHIYLESIIKDENDVREAVLSIVENAGFNIKEAAII